MEQPTLCPSLDMPKLIVQHGRRVGAKKEEASREECHKPREETIRSHLKASLRGSFQRSTSPDVVAFVHDVLYLLEINAGGHWKRGWLLVFHLSKSWSLGLGLVDSWTEFVPFICCHGAGLVHLFHGGRKQNLLSHSQPSLKYWKNGNRARIQIIIIHV